MVMVSRSLLKANVQSFDLKTLNWVCLGHLCHVVLLRCNPVELIRVDVDEVRHLCRRLCISVIWICLCSSIIIRRRNQKCTIFLRNKDKIKVVDNGYSALQDIFILSLSCQSNMFIILILTIVWPHLWLRFRNNYEAHWPTETLLGLDITSHHWIWTHISHHSAY